MRSATSALVLCLSLLCVPGCGDGPGPDDEPVEPTPICDDGEMNGEETGVDCGGTCTACAEEPPANPWAAPVETDDWRILFNYRGRIDNSTKGQNNLWVMDPEGLEMFQVTDFGADDDDDKTGSWTCNYGCVVSPDLKWIAVVIGPPTVNGFTFEIGIIKEDLSVKMMKFLPFENKIDFKFAGDKLFYTEKLPCTGVSCQYDLFMFDLSGLDGSNKVLTFPTAAELEHSTYKGHFKVSPAGDKVVLLNTTIRSVTVNMWIDGTGLIELDYICKFGTKGNCSGTGSEYSDIDPVAISPDGRYVVFFTYSDRWQRARVYDAENPGVVTFSVLAEVATGSYIEHACDPGVLAEWQWERVIGAPVFTPDGSEVVFLTSSACPLLHDEYCGGNPAPCQPTKERRNIRRIKLNTLLDGASLDSEDVHNVTQNPFGDVTDNRLVSGFALSPDGATLVLTATPTFTQSQKKIEDGSARQRNDSEVYRLRLDGEGMQQLSNDLGWAAESPRAVPSGP